MNGKTITNIESWIEQDHREETQKESARHDDPEQRNSGDNDGKYGHEQRGVKYRWLSPEPERNYEKFGKLSFHV